VDRENICNFFYFGSGEKTIGRKKKKSMKTNASYMENNGMGLTSCERIFLLDTGTVSDAIFTNTNSRKALYKCQDVTANNQLFLKNRHKALVASAERIILIGHYSSDFG